MVFQDKQETKPVRKNWTWMVKKDYEELLKAKQIEFSSTYGVWELMEVNLEIQRIRTVLKGLGDVC